MKSSVTVLRQPESVAVQTGLNLSEAGAAESQTLYADRVEPGELVANEGPGEGR